MPPNSGAKKKVVPKTKAKSKRKGDASPSGKSEGGGDDIDALIAARRSELASHIEARESDPKPTKAEPKPAKKSILGGLFGRKSVEKPRRGRLEGPGSVDDVFGQEATSSPSPNRGGSVEESGELRSLRAGTMPRYSP